MSTNTRSHLATLVREHIAPLAGVVLELDPRNVPLPHAEDLLDAFTELERLATSGRLLMTARAVEAGRWKAAGCPSPTVWLAAKQGTTSGRARADLETSERLGSLPDTADAVRSGQLSAEKAHAVADGASVNPAAEDDLLATARRDSLKHTRQEAARRRAEVESELTKRQRENKTHAERTARWGTKNGRAWLYAEGPLGSGADLQQALTNRVGEIFKERSVLPEAEREGRDQYAYDALIDLVCGKAGTDEAPSRRGPVRKLMLVRVDLSALIRGETIEGEVCEIPGIGPVSVAEARAMYGDAVVRLITTNGTAVIDVVNPNRKPRDGQRIALLWADPKCVVEGCDREIHLEYEHRIDFRGSRHTVIGESEHMCEHDHDLKTLQNWQLVDGTGRRPFVPPTDPRHPDNTRLADTG